MPFHADNMNIATGSFNADYIVFGKGKRPLIILPGVGDGFQTARGIAGPFSWLYRDYAADYRVYTISRRNHLPEKYSTLEMATDLALIMEKLDLRDADVLGVSQGGMIAQQLAIHYPAYVRKLVLAVTCARPYPIFLEAGAQWLIWAEENDYASIMLDTAERSYTGKYLEKARRAYAVLARISKPKDFARFITLCKSCLEHNTVADLHKISCPTLIIGGEEDRIVGAEASRELQAGIPGSELYLYPGQSHGVYEQADDFNERVLTFLLERK